MKEQSKPRLKYRDLPPHLQRKYKNSPIFEKETNSPDPRFDFDLRKLRERKAQKQKTIEQKLEQFKINSTEEKYLLRVFQSLANGGKHFGEPELRQVLKRMGSKMTKAEIERMLWEFDEDLNRKISEKEFLTMYKKCTIDPAAAESKNLFHLTQFLMYCRPDNYRITVEDTLELLFVRAKLQLERYGKCEEKEIIRKLEHEIDVIFEGEEKTVEGLEKEITFEEYLTRISRRAIEKRRRQIEKAKSALKYGAQPIDDDDN